MIRPIIAIVGRPNVGKSTLFNRLVGRRRSLVRDVPGVTRDRLYGTVAFERWQATVVDTGGFDPSTTSDLVAGRARPGAARPSTRPTSSSSWWTARAGITPLDDGDRGASCAGAGRPVLLAVNKVDGAGQETALGDVYRLGFAPVLAGLRRARARRGRAARGRAASARPRAGARRPRSTARAWPSSGGPTSASRRSSTRCSATSACSCTTRPAPRATRWTRR